MKLDFDPFDPFKPVRSNEIEPLMMGREELQHNTLAEKIFPFGQSRPRPSGENVGHDDLRLKRKGRTRRRPSPDEVFKSSLRGISDESGEDVWMEAERVPDDAEVKGDVGLVLQVVIVCMKGTESW
jgi:hypothetical protein